MGDVERYLDGVREEYQSAGLDILFSGDGPELVFVEVERRDTHESVRWGKWFTRVDGLQALAVPTNPHLPRLEAAVRKVWKRRYTPQDTGDLDYRTADGYQRGYEQAMHEAREIIREALEVDHDKG